MWKLRIFMWSAGGLALFISKPPGEDAAAGGLYCAICENIVVLFFCVVLVLDRVVACTRYLDLGLSVHIIYTANPYQYWLKDDKHKNLGTIMI